MYYLDPVDYSLNSVESLEQVYGRPLMSDAKKMAAMLRREISEGDAQRLQRELELAQRRAKEKPSPWDKEAEKFEECKYWNGQIRQLRQEIRTGEKSNAELLRRVEQLEREGGRYEKAIQVLVENEHLKIAFNEFAQSDPDGFMQVNNGEPWSADGMFYCQEAYSIWRENEPKPSRHMLLKGRDKVITNILQKDDRASIWNTNPGGESHLIFKFQRGRSDPNEALMRQIGMKPKVSKLDLILPPTDGVSFAGGIRSHVPLAWFLEYPQLFLSMLSAEDVQAANRLSIKYLFGNLYGVEDDLVFRLRSPRVASHALMLVEPAHPKNTTSYHENNTSKFLAKDNLFKELVDSYYIHSSYEATAWIPTLPSPAEKWQLYLNGRQFVGDNTEVLCCLTENSCLAALELKNLEAFRFPKVDNWYKDPLLHHILREQCYYTWCRYFYPDRVRF